MASRWTADKTVKWPCTCLEVPAIPLTEHHCSDAISIRSQGLFVTVTVSGLPQLTTRSDLWR